MNDIIRYIRWWIGEFRRGRAEAQAVLDRLNRNSELDRSSPRALARAYIDADVDHAPVPESAFRDEIFDNCSQCGLAVTSDGTRHGGDRG